jgi:hypothetical protein
MGEAYMVAFVAKKNDGAITRYFTLEYDYVLATKANRTIVCERDFDGSTQFKRQRREKLAEWLEHYTLGDLWKKGEIGGNRW